MIEAHGHVERETNLFVVNLNDGRWRRDGVNRCAFGCRYVISEEEVNTWVHRTKILLDHRFFGDRDDNF